jgi:pimeloyl-ACP methyl ester carboxylesterase
MSGARESVARPSRLGWLFAFAVTTLVLTGLPPAALSATKIAQHSPDMSRPHVYLMRGLLNIFSLGMDQLATEIQGHGIEASVYNHTLADSVVAQIVQKYRAGDHGPYILVGHSLGADAVMMMAQSLNAQGVPVALVVPFDGTGSYAASKNVACVLNLTQRVYAYMRPGSGFRGKLQNVDVSSDPSIDHFTIDKSPRLQGMALTSILQTAHAETCRPGANAPAVARPKEAPAPQFAAPREQPQEQPNGAPGEAPKQSSVEVPAKTASPPPRGDEG